MGFSISAGEVFGLSCSFVWALNSLMVRTQSQAIPPAMMNGIRCAVATVFFWALLPFGPPLASYAHVTGTEWALLVGGLLIGMAMGETMYLAAIKEIGVSRAMSLSGTFPLSTFFFEWALLQNPFNRRFFLGICLVAVGVIFLSSRARQSSGERPVRLALGMFLALFACLLWGLSTVMLKPAIAHMTSVQANSVRVPLTAAVLFLAPGVDGSGDAYPEYRTAGAVSRGRQRHRRRRRGIHAVLDGDQPDRSRQDGHPGVCLSQFLGC